jgi:hypothetical protein
MDTPTVNVSSTTNSGPLANHPILRRILRWGMLSYFLGAIVTFPYFSWVYIDEHGLNNWLLAGALRPVGRSIVWPTQLASVEDNATSRERRRANKKLSDSVTIVFEMSRETQRLLDESNWYEAALSARATAASIEVAYARGFNDSFSEKWISGFAKAKKEFSLLAKLIDSKNYDQAKIVCKSARESLESGIQWQDLDQ